MAAVHKYDLTILEHHLDTLGHVNNATYLSLFEQARWELITENDYGISEVHRRKQSPIIMRVEMDFKAEVLNREEVVIETELIEYPSKAGKLEQRMLKSDGSLACKAIFVFGLFDLEKRKLIEPSPEWKKAIGLGA